MKWFDGNIPQAIGAAKELGGVFVVFIYDKSESSKQARVNVDNEEVSSILSSGLFVPIQLENGSPEAKQFSEIYPLIVVPSLFLISGRSGIPLEVIGGNFGADSLLPKIRQVLKKIEEPDTVEAPTVASGASSGTVAVTPTIDITAPESTTDDQTHAGSSTSETPVTNASASAPSTSTCNVATSSADSDSDPSVGLEERIERAKTLLEEKQKQNEDEKQEEEKTKEVERRRQGKGTSRAKQKREADEFKEFATQRRREKQEDKIHRERVKAQIAADRVERERREALFKDPAAASPPPRPEPASPIDSSSTRIKFRFPDSSSINGQFNSDDPLSAVVTFVRENAVLPMRHFTLFSILHHRPFTEDQMGSSLRDLGLVPSTMIIVKPSSSGPVSNVVPSGSSFYDAFWSFLSPITFILDYVKRLLGLNPQPPPPRRGEDAPIKREDSPPKRMRTDDSSSTRSRHSAMYGSRRDGNVHRLNRDSDDDDDENNTWNGNSTQQM